MRQPNQLDNYMQHIQVRKIWADRHSIFTWFLQACPMGLTLHLERTPYLGLVKSLLLTSLWFVFYWCLYLLTSRRQLQQKPPVVPSLPPGVRTKTSDLQFSLIIFNYNKSLGLAVQRLSAFFFSYIYLFIHSIRFYMSRSITLHWKTIDS